MFLLFDLFKLKIAYQIALEIKKNFCATFSEIGPVQLFSHSPVDSLDRINRTAHISATMKYTTNFTAIIYSIQLKHVKYQLCFYQ